MCRTFSVRFLRSCALASVVMILAAGCNEVRENVASVIKPKTVGEVVVDVNQHIAQSKFSQARIEGEEFLKNNDDAAGMLAWALAKACVQMNDHEAGINYLQQALGKNADYMQQAINEPLLEPIHTDIRFVSLIGNVNPIANPITAAPPQSSTATSLNSKGIEARAGSVVVKLPE